jgi:predicted esterase
MTAREHRLTVPRTARYHVLGEPGPAVRDVWIVLHGYGQLGGAFVRRFEPIASDGRLIAAPEALSRFYVEQAGPEAEGRPRHERARPGASWMTREDRAAEIADYVRYLDLVATRLAQDVDLGAATLRVLGFSQGVATAARWAVLGARRVDHLVLWGGTPPDDLPADALRERLARARVTLVAGDADPIVRAEAHARHAEAWRARGLVVDTMRFVGGHALDAGVLRALAG